MKQIRPTYSDVQYLFGCASVVATIIWAAHTLGFALYGSGFFPDLFTDAEISIESTIYQIGFWWMIVCFTGAAYVGMLFYAERKDY